MSTLKKHIKSDKLKWVITFVSIALILGLLISVIVGLSNLQPTKNVGSLDYSISSIDTTTGKVIDSNQNIVMKNLGNVDGMEITLDEDAQITYKVAFYDENKDFVSITDKQSTDFDAESIPATAKYFRVVITPNQVDGENVTVTLLNMANYTSQIDITFNK